MVREKRVWRKTKFATRFFKNRRLGKCVICGKDSKPYLNCSECRFKKKVRRAMRLLEIDGAVKLNWKGFGYPKLYERTEIKSARPTKRSDREDDKRHLPRIKYKPIDLENLIDLMPKKFTEEMIAEKILELKLKEPTK